MTLRDIKSLAKFFNKPVKRLVDLDDLIDAARTFGYFSTANRIMEYRDHMWAFIDMEYDHNASINQT